jgi:hypothetical protein
VTFGGGMTIENTGRVLPVGAASACHSREESQRERQRAWAERWS